jgi:hypothetical protein
MSPFQALSLRSGLRLGRGQPHQQRVLLQAEHLIQPADQTLQLSALEELDHSLQQKSVKSGMVHSLDSAEPNTDFFLLKMNDNFLAYQFEIYNIQNWAFDEGKKLLEEEKGCSGALSFWDWTPATDTEGPFVYLGLPFLMRGGCVERAIVSAGGPKIQCKGAGILIGRGTVSE